MIRALCKGIGGPKLPDRGIDKFCQISNKVMTIQCISHSHINPRRRVMKKFECPCGYIYDPELGDPENGVAAGTAFEDVPEDWVCPKCGAEKEFFEELD